MELYEIYTKMLDAKDPHAFFGDLSGAEDLKKSYKQYAKLTHPDTAPVRDRYLAQEAFTVLGGLYQKALQEMEEGVYGVTDPVELYRHTTPMFELTVNGHVCSFYEYVCEGEVANVYRGVSDGEIVYLKMAADPQDNSLLDNEFAVLSAIRHVSLPYPRKRLRVNSRTALLLREAKRSTLPALRNEYPYGLEEIHAVWMLERLLSVVGYLHSHLVVHGNIKPENTVVNKENHQISLLGFSFCIPEANKPEAKYRIVNEGFSAPEVNADARVLPAADIYSVGKLGVYLLGGDPMQETVPQHVNPALRVFLRKMLRPDPALRADDAWKLWTDLTELRAEVYGPKKFIPLK